MRTREGAQEGDVTHPAGGVLQGREPSVGGAAEQGERQAQLVVEGPLGEQRVTEAGEHLSEQVLGRGLATAARDAERQRLVDGEGRAGQGLQGGQRVGHDERRHGDRQLAGTQDRDGPARHGRLGEIVPVDPLAGQRDEQRPRSREP